MPDTTQLRVLTFNTYYDPDNVLSRTFYTNSNAGSGAFAFITEGAGNIDGNEVLEGFGVIVLSNTFEGANVSFSLDAEGNLIASGPDADKYTIDGDGNLCYNP